MAGEPCALLLDDPEGEALAPVALRLIRMGLDVLYTKWEDEARLLAYEAEGRIRAILASPRIDTGVLEVARSVVERTSLRDAPVVLIGDRPDPAVCDRLRKAGVEHALFAPYDDGELRFVVNAAMVLEREIAPRREPRAPANQLCWLVIGGTRSFGVLYTISAKGAYVEMAHPLPPNETPQLEFDFEGLPIEVATRVLYRMGPDQAQGSMLPCGMGVAFEGLPRDLEEKLRDFARERARRYVL